MFFIDASRLMLFVLCPRAELAFNLRFKANLLLFCLDLLLLIKISLPEANVVGLLFLFCCRMILFPTINKNSLAKYLTSYPL